MEDKYRGLEFITDKGKRCLIVKNEINDNYVIVDLDEYTTIARCNYDNIEETINSMKNNY